MLEITINNHCEITGAHFKYDDAYNKLLKLLESKKQDERREERKMKASKDLLNKKMSEVAKVKIMLNYNKKPTIGM